MLTRVQNQSTRATNRCLEISSFQALGCGWAVSLRPHQCQRLQTCAARGTGTPRREALRSVSQGAVAASRCRARDPAYFVSSFFLVVGCICNFFLLAGCDDADPVVSRIMRFGFAVAIPVVACLGVPRAIR